MTRTGERMTAITGISHGEGRPWYVTVHDRSLPVERMIGTAEWRDYPQVFFGTEPPSLAAREAALMEMGWERVPGAAWEYVEIEDHDHPDVANWGLLTDVTRLPEPAPVNIDGEDLLDTTGMHLLPEEVAA